MNEKLIPSIDYKLGICLENFQQRAASMWLGREKEAIIALTRVLDYSAVSRHWRMTGEYLPVNTGEMNHALIVMGCASALRPFLSVTRGQSGGIPYGPSHPETTRFAYSYLNVCGKLTFLRRMASLERYGLATTEQLNPEHFRITVSAGAPEQAIKYSRQLLAQESESPLSTRKLKHWNKLHARMRRYVQSTDGWFIRYDNDWQIVDAYREKARLLGQGYLEAEAFPDDVIIGDRTFGAWKEACNQAVGRILAHMDFSAFLHSKNPTVTLDNVLTIFAKRDDVEAIWREAGLPASQVTPTMHALTLEFDDLHDWEQAFEVPTVFYIGLGKNFVLLPCFGALTNPYFALFRHLRETYRSDWDRAVDQREAVFRADLATVFAPSRFTIPDHGFKLRRPNGSVITDIDALILDNETGDLALVQLKWHDVFGFSLRERESRRKNIAKANEWVERVFEWVNGRSSKELASALGIKAQASSRPPLLYVVARYGARFTGDHIHDDRAHWMAWSEIKSAHKYLIDDDESPLFQIPSWVKMCQIKFEKYEIKSWDFKFPNLQVQLEIPITKIEQ